MRTAVWTAVLVLGLATGAESVASRRQGPARPVPSGRTFALSADFSGYIGSTLLVGGVHYRLAPDVSISIVGQGPVKPGIVVQDASIFIAGDRRGEGGIIRSILIRPGLQPAADRGDHGVRVKPTSAPH